MINLNRKNFITGIKYDVEMAMYRIIDFFDLMEYNMLFLQNSNLGYSQKYKISQIDFNNIEDLHNIIKDNSNLFRVNLIIIDLYNIDIKSVKKIQDTLYNTGIKFIILSNDYFYDKNDNEINIYKIVKEIKPTNNSKSYFNTESIYIVNDIINKNKYTFDDYLKYIQRKIKLDKILK